MKDQIAFQRGKDPKNSMSIGLAAIAETVTVDEFKALCYIIEAGDEHIWDQFINSNERGRRLRFLHSIFKNSIETGKEFATWNNEMNEFRTVDFDEMFDYIRKNVGLRYVYNARWGRGYSLVFSDIKFPAMILINKKYLDQQRYEI